MKAVAQRVGTYAHTIKIRQHEIRADEPASVGGTDEAPNPQELLAASLASCTAITMEMYAARKGWDVSELSVECEFTAAERGCPTKFELVYTFPPSLTDEQIQRLCVIAAKCPVHRVLDGEVMFDERVGRPAPVR